MFAGETAKPASAKAIEERLAKLKREGRAIIAESGNPPLTTTTTSSATPAKKTKKPGAAAAAKKETVAKRKTFLKEEDSENEGDEELDLGESDDEDMPPAKKAKSGKTDNGDKPSAKKAKTIAPTGPKRVTYSDDEDEEVKKNGKSVGEMEVDSLSGESDNVKHKET